MRPLALITALLLAVPAVAQEAAPEPTVIVEDNAPVTTGIIVGLLGILALAAALASAGD